jgi:MscS family membrane protein
MLTIVGAVWLVLSIVDFTERLIQRRFQATGLGEKMALLRLGRRALDVIVVVSGALIVLNVFGIDPTAALAGLGIGGIAVALAAQKTLENVIGGLSLVFDEAVQVGDTVKLGEIVGTVEQIGLRSTRIRTVDRTMLTVPNGQISAASIETVSVRDKFLFRHIVGLRYETSSAELRAVVDGVRAFLVGTTGVEAESVRVRFVRFGPSSLDLELFAYFYAVDWPAFLEIQEGLLLRVMGIVEESGSGIAFPSQTLYLKEGRVSPPAAADAQTVGT